MSSTSGVVPAGGSTRPAVGGAALAAAAGLLSGAVGAYCYYDPVLRPISHTLGLWLIVAVVVTARQPPRRAILHASVALLSAVIAFYVGKKVMYALRYPGQPYSLNYTEIGLWIVLAVAAGLGLGWAFRRIGDQGWPGAAAAAAAAGLLLGDAVHRGYRYRDDIPVVATTAVVGLVLLVVLSRHDRRRQLARAALLTVPAALGAVALVSLPDLLEQFVLIGL
jgi:uncharacterized membrane protein (UPF0136 family)